MGLSLPGELAEQIEHILAELHYETEAECILLADISGQLICTQGQMMGIDPVLVAALAAGNVAAMSELTRQIGEESHLGSFLHEGDNKGIYLFNVGNSFVLIVIFQINALLGLVRLLGGRAAGQLHALSAQFEEHMNQPHSIPNADFGAALADELDKAFGELL